MELGAVGTTAEPTTPPSDLADPADPVDPVMPVKPQGLPPTAGFIHSADRIDAAEPIDAADLAGTDDQEPPSTQDGAASSGSGAAASLTVVPEQRRPAHPLLDVSDAELAAGIAVRAGRLAAAEADLLAWIAEFDRRTAWSGPGMLSCAHWLSWKLGWSLKAAYERVRVAHALAQLPALAEVFAAGRLSWSKTRAVTRVAKPATEHEWINVARNATGAQLDRLVRGVRRAHLLEDAEKQARDARPPWPSECAGGTGAAEATGAASGETGPEPADGSGTAEGTGAAGVEAAAGDTWANAGADCACPTELAGAPDRFSADGARPGRSRQREHAEDQGAGRDTGTLDDQGPDSYGAGAGARVRVSYDSDGFLVLNARLPAEDGAVLMAALEAAGVAFAQLAGSRSDSPAGESVHRPAPQAGQETPGKTPGAAGGSGGAGDVVVPHPAPNQADALLTVARVCLDALSVGESRPARRHARARLTAHIDPRTGWARLPDGELLPPNARLLSSLAGTHGLIRLRPLSPSDLTAHDQGRRLREPGEPLRGLLEGVDGRRCRFPGCSGRRNLHAHHVIYWSAGGTSDLSNLVLVCARHHTLIHQENYQLQLTAERHLTVHTPAGVLVPAVELLPAAPAPAAPTQAESLDHDAALQPDFYSRVNFAYAVSVLAALAA